MRIERDRAEQLTVIARSQRKLLHRLNEPSDKVSCQTAKRHIAYYIARQMESAALVRCGRRSKPQCQSGSSADKHACGFLSGAGALTFDQCDRIARKYESMGKGK